jgi:phenylpropionate dioxygenase-like ring-hydroxylating dioxygenase large terminal subunit
MNRMAKRHSSELVDNMQKKSYKDMNAEFWVTHKWYLAAVVCFVTLNVLYTTAYIVTTYD